MNIDIDKLKKVANVASNTDLATWKELLLAGGFSLSLREALALIERVEQEQELLARIVPAANLVYDMADADLNGLDVDRLDETEPADRKRWFELANVVLGELNNPLAYVANRALLDESYLDRRDGHKYKQALAAANELIEAQHEAMQGLVVYSCKDGHKVSRARARVLYADWKGDKR